MKQDECYRLLGICPGSSKDVIVKAFREKAKKHHPDTGGDANMFQEIYEAYQSILTKYYPLKATLYLSMSEIINGATVDALINDIPIFVTYDGKQSLPYSFTYQYHTICIELTIELDPNDTWKIVDNDCARSLVVKASDILLNNTIKLSLPSGNDYFVNCNHFRTTDTIIIPRSGLYISEDLRGNAIVVVTIEYDKLSAIQENEIRAIVNKTELSHQIR